MRLNPKYEFRTCGSEFPAAFQDVFEAAAHVGNLAGAQVQDVAKRLADGRDVLLDVCPLLEFLANPDRPVQMVFAGKAHPADKPGQELIRRIFDVSRHSELRGRIVFLENYNMRIGRMLVQGVDVWLNNPRRPYEASGTSGMKAACNGAPNFSVSDGWWCEAADHGKNGWTIGNSEEFDNPDDQDAHDSESLYQLLEHAIAPLYYTQTAAGLPLDWINVMKASIATITPRFSTARMVRDYAEEAYLPAAKRGGATFAARAAEPTW